MHVWTPICTSVVISLQMGSRRTIGCLIVGQPQQPTTQTSDLLFPPTVSSTPHVRSTFITKRTNHERRSTDIETYSGVLIYTHDCVVPPHSNRACVWLSHHHQYPNEMPAIITATTTTTKTNHDHNKVHFYDHCDYYYDDDDSYHYDDDTGCDGDPAT